MPDATRVRWAIVGTGMISEQIASDLLHTENAQIVAVCSRSEEHASTFSEKFGITQRFTDYTAMLQESSIDAVYIGTPHITHHPLAREAMLAGKHVLCEKPAALDSEQLADLLEVARDTGVFFMEAMWMKFNPGFQSLRTALESGAIGEVRSVRASFGLPFPRDESSRWRADMAGSALLDQGIYPVTLADLACGEPEVIQARGNSDGSGIDYTEFVTLGFAAGQTAQLASSMTEFIDPSASISGTRGWITVPAMFWVSTSYTIHRPTATDFLATEEISFEREGWGYVPMLRAASDAIAHGSQEHPVHTWEDTARVFRLLDGIRSALHAEARSGAPS